MFDLSFITDPVDNMRKSHMKTATNIDMTRKSRYPAHLLGNIAIYLYIIWIWWCYYDLLFFYIIYL